MSLRFPLVDQRDIRELDAQAGLCGDAARNRRQRGHCGLVTDGPAAVSRRRQLHPHRGPGRRRYAQLASGLCTFNRSSSTDVMFCLIPVAALVWSVMLTHGRASDYKPIKAFFFFIGVLSELFVHVTELSQHVWNRAAEC